VVFGVVAEEGGEALGFEHEARIVCVGGDAEEGVFSSLEVKVFFGLLSCDERE
jgi:hypothetical protein